MGLHRLLVVLSLLAPAVAPAAERIVFNRDVRPILSDKCFTCHGPDDAKREAGLRLDLESGSRAVLESGATAVVPGNLDASAVVSRITSDDPDVVMPPPHLGKAVTAAEAEILRRWISEGAEYQGHWAFTRVGRPSIPDVRDADWCRGPLDRFVAVRLENSGLRPNPEADRATLARRLALDLTGLPPTPAEVDAFVNDPATDAYERHVDRLLASDHFGERMAIEWLDAARYADSHGFQADSSRQNWPWRDWVIRAFNANMPFDAFTVKQLAGDLLPDASRDDIVATGFNRNHRINGEQGSIAAEWLVETIVDRVESTGQTWMGLTVGCCRCHDHKYDPISQREFYSLYAFFNSMDESGMLAENRGGGNSLPVLRLPDQAQQAEITRLTRVVDEADAAVKSAEACLDSLAAAWAEEAKAALAGTADAWQPLEPVEIRSTGGAVFRRLEDGSWIAEGADPPSDTYEIEAPLPEGTFGALRIEVIPDGSFAGRGGFSRSGNGNIMVTRVEAEIEKPDGGVERIDLIRAAADYAQEGFGAEQALTGKNGKKGWSIGGHKKDPELRVPRRLAVMGKRRLDVDENSRVVLRIRQEAGDHRSIGRFRVAYSSADPALVTVDGLGLPAEVEAAVEVSPETRSDAQKAALAKHYRAAVDGPISRAEAARDAAKKSLEAFENSVPSVMVMREGKPRDTFVLVRGEYDKPGEQVTATVPAFLPPLPAGATADRLALARWVVSRDHPLTSRVWVNRQWERFFGTGLVKTSENLGSQAEYPSHPELLDWLAAEFMESGWDMKRMIRSFVTSATYRQSAAVTPEKLAADPENRLLARAPRIRLPGEIVRDQALAVAGLLVPQVGGPSVRPWMPDGVWDETSVYGDLRGYKPDSGPGRYRRSMYTIWKRTAAPPTMLLFDAPNREICIVKRARTNTPLQALALLNETTFIETAHGLAGRMLCDAGPAPAERISHAFRLALGRQPAAGELATLVAGYESDLARFTSAPEEAAKYAAVGLVRKPDDTSDAEFAAASMTANVILNLDEFVMRE
ncbi:MAG: PSD1 and planctomycete cytochrome C domain-containing protein [Planctomycetota bacterium]